MMNRQIIVVGGGMSGVAAAIAAKKQGADTLLFERYGFFGGTSTASMVSPFMSFSAGNKQLVYGVFQEILDQLLKYGGRKAGSRAFDSETLKFVLYDLLDKYKVDYLLHTYLTGVVREGNLIKEIITESKNGQEHFAADFFVDTSADADLAAKAGVEFEVGREKDGLTQAMTLMFRIANVKMKEVLEYCRKNPENYSFIEEDINGVSIAGFKKEIEEERQITKFDNPLDYIFFVTTHRDDLVIVNTTRSLRVSGLSNVDLSRAQSEGHHNAWQIYELLKKRIPGFEDSYISNTATQVGVRETRRIIGEYTMTGIDIVSAKKFDDVIARGSYPIDIHDPTGGGGQMIRLKEGEYYDIPFRSLIPKNINNLLVAGRCISATHEAQASIRITATCTAMGEAAGNAAALCVKNNVTPVNLDIKELQKYITSNISG
ncbi:MAG: FAD-dependent oxidoreductase [Candidatus Sericytochromatia bacterium]|nr:FAD-dependent oxidoreductase [Candidatus Sericytochromatia bacterium]